MNVVSLFSGAGGMDLGFNAAGLHARHMCEIDPQAASVLRRHWPDAVIWKDVRELEPEHFGRTVDLVHGGSPCQDLSMAGKRSGLAGERSGLYWHFVRLVDGCAPSWVVFENVAGLLTSNGGADFAAVLWGLTGALPDVPADGWLRAGIIAGPKRWAVWRMLDASGFGVAQRRRRVFIVAGAGGRPRPDVLLESDCLRGSVRTRVTAREEAPASLRTGTQVPFVKTHRATSSSDDEVWRHRDVAPSIDASESNNHTLVAFSLTPFSGQGADLRVTPVDQAGAVTATEAKMHDRGIRVVDKVGLRRLTCREWERLMGWPDDHTRWTADGEELARTPRFKMIGNGVAAPVAQWIGERIVAVTPF